MPLQDDYEIENNQDAKTLISGFLVNYDDDEDDVKIELKRAHVTCSCVSCASGSSARTWRVTTTWCPPSWARTRRRRSGRAAQGHRGGEGAAADAAAALSVLAVQGVQRPIREHAQEDAACQDP